MKVDLTLPDARAIEIALDELIAYVGTVGEEDDAYGRIVWTIKRLRHLLRKAGYAVPEYLTKP